MISIIVPVYNADKYLKRCVDSLLCQSCRTDFELLLIDDGSKDNSPLICEEYARSDHRVHVYHQKNGGASSARNKGIELSKGEWVLFVDADDEVAPNLIERVESVPLIDVDIVFFGYRMIFPNREVKCNPVDGLVTPKDFSRIITECEIYTPWSKAFRKDLLINNDIRFNLRLRNGEDTLFMFQFLNKIEKAYLINDVLYTHYVIEGSLSATIVPYDLNVLLLTQISELSENIINRFSLTTEAKNKIMELRSVCIGRIINMNVSLGKMNNNRQIMDSLDLELYGRYLHPITLKGKIYKFLLMKRMYYLIDIINKLFK